MSIVRHVQAILLALITLLSLASCATEPELVGLTSVVFNYSQDALAEVQINEKTAGAAIQDAKFGEVKGGGKSMCCIRLSPVWTTVSVKVTDSNGKAFTIPATIEQPWPKYVHYAAVHILPGKKAVIEVTSSIPWQRMDLLETQIKEMREKQ